MAFILSVILFTLDRLAYKIRPNQGLPTHGHAMTSSLLPTACLALGLSTLLPIQHIDKTIITVLCCLLFLICLAIDPHCYADITIFLAIPTTRNTDSDSSQTNIESFNTYTIVFQGNTIPGSDCTLHRALGIAGYPHASIASICELRKPAGPGQAPDHARPVQ